MKTRGDLRDELDEAPVHLRVRVVLYFVRPNANRLPHGHQAAAHGARVFDVPGRPRHRLSGVHPFSAHRRERDARHLASAAIVPPDAPPPDHLLYCVRFARLGENRLTIVHDGGRERISSSSSPSRSKP